MILKDTNFRGLVSRTLWQTVTKNSTSDHISLSGFPQTWPTNVPTVWIPGILSYLVTEIILAKSILFYINGWPWQLERYYSLFLVLFLFMYLLLSPFSISCFNAYSDSICLFMSCTQLYLYTAGHCCLQHRFSDHFFFTCSTSSLRIFTEFIYKSKWRLISGTCSLYVLLFFFFFWFWLRGCLRPPWTACYERRDGQETHLTMPKSAFSH